MTAALGTVVDKAGPAFATVAGAWQVWVAEAARLRDAAMIDRTATAGIPSAARGGPAASDRSADLLFASTPIGYGRLPAIETLKPTYAEIATGAPDCRTETCRFGRETVRTVIAANREAGFVKLVEAVNRSVNKLVRYRRDIDTHGVVDRWSSPSETISTGVGDCEDYAILKMAVLAEAGIPMKSMSIVVLKDVRRNVFHAVLAVKTSAGSFVLDNLSSAVRRDTDLPDYQPLYSVSAGRGYIYGRAAAPALTASGPSMLSVAPGEGVDGEPVSDQPASSFEGGSEALSFSLE